MLSIAPDKTDTDMINKQTPDTRHLPPQTFKSQNSVFRMNSGLTNQPNRKDFGQINVTN